MDKKFRVVVNYDSGNSFGRDPDQEEEVWDNDDEGIAKENCYRIKAQQVFNEAMESRARYSFRQKEPAPEQPAFVVEDNAWGMKLYQVLLLDDERKEHKVSCLSWQGYFERFNYVEVRIEPYRL